MALIDSALLKATVLHLYLLFLLQSASKLADAFGDGHVLQMVGLSKAVK
jgi:hypothetical protein